MVVGRVDVEAKARPFALAAALSTWASAFFLMIGGVIALGGELYCPL